MSDRESIPAHRVALAAGIVIRLGGFTEGVPCATRAKNLVGSAEPPQYKYWNNSLLLKFPWPLSSKLDKKFGKWTVIDAKNFANGPPIAVNLIWYSASTHARYFI